MRKSLALVFGSLVTLTGLLSACSGDSADTSSSSSSSSSGGEETDAGVDATASSSGSTSSASSSGSTSSSSSSSSSSGAIGDDAGEGGIDSDGDAGVDAGTPFDAIRFVGRFDFRDPIGPRFEWSGSTILARFSGTGIAIDLGENTQPDGHNVFRVSIDGGEPTLLTLTESVATRYVLAAGLADGEHTVEVYRRTEALFGSVQFLGFSVTGGALLDPPALPTRRVQFVGDSITAGYGNEGSDPCMFGPGNEDGYRAYGAVTARALEAQYSAIAWSGRGMFRNYDDAAVPTMPTLYDYTRPSDPTGLWDHQSYVPDAVVIYLGTNDAWSDPYDENKDPGQDFENTYVTFMTRVRGLYPLTEIFALAAPERSGVVNRVQSAVTTRTTAGDAKVHYVQFAAYDYSQGLGCDGHPNVVADQRMADTLATVIRGVLNW